MRRSHYIEIGLIVLSLLVAFLINSPEARYLVELGIDAIRVIMMFVLTCVFGIGVFLVMPYILGVYQRNFVEEHLDEWIEPAVYIGTGGHWFLSILSTVVVGVFFPIIAKLVVLSPPWTGWVYSIYSFLFSYGRPPVFETYPIKFGIVAAILFFLGYWYKDWKDNFYA